MTHFYHPSRSHAKGTTILQAPPELWRCGSIGVAVSRDEFPNQADLDFMTIYIERSLDNWRTVIPVGSQRMSGRRIDATSTLRLLRTNADGHGLPMLGHVRARLVSRRAFAGSLSLFLDEAVTPPPLKPRHHSVAHDGEANLSAVGHFANTVTVEDKTTAGTDRLAVAHLGHTEDVGTTFTSLTYGGVNMTAMGTEAIRADVFAASGLYYFVAPATGATDVTFVLSDDGRIVLGVSSYDGVDQSTPIRAGSYESADGNTTPAELIVTSATGDMVVDSIFDASPAGPTVGADQTQTHKVENTLGGEYWGCGSYEAGASSVTMSWTSADTWAYVAASLQAAGGVAAITTEYVAPTVLQAGVAMIGRRYV